MHIVPPIVLLGILSDPIGSVPGSFSHQNQGNSVLARCGSLPQSSVWRRSLESVGMGLKGLALLKLKFVNAQQVVLGNVN